MPSTLRRYALVGTLFVIGILLGLVLWNEISLPYDNPHKVMGVLAQIRFNPTSNLVRFAVFVMMPVLVLVLVAFVSGQRRDLLFSAEMDVSVIDHDTRFFSSRKWYVALALIALVIASHYRYLSNPEGGKLPPRIDHFHDGEALAAAVSYEHGLIPYRDFFVARGIYQDPGKTLLAFRLLGRSVASVHTLENLQIALTFVALGGLALLMFGGNYLASALFAALFSLYTVIGYMAPSRLWERDLLCFLFLIALLLIMRRSTRTEDESPIRPWIVYLASFVLGFLPSSGFAYTLDRGYFLSMVFLIVWPILFLVILRDNPLRRGFAIASGLGLVTGIGVLGIAVRWALADFFRFTFVQVPSYKEFVDGFEYALTSTHFRAGFYRFYVLVLQAIAVFWLAYKLLQMVTMGKSGFRSSLIEFIRAYAFEMALLLMALTSFRYGLGRSDRFHIAAAASLTMIFLTYVFIRYYLPRLVIHSSLKRSLYAFVIVVLAGVSVWNIHRFITRHVWAQAYPVGRTDREMVEEDYRQVVEYLKPRLTQASQFVTLTNEGSWYYLLDQPSPIIFPEVWFGSTDYFQSEMVAQLDAKPVHYILYRNDAVWNAIDSVDNQQRLPIVFDYVHRNFRPDRKIGSHEIWMRRGLSIPQDSSIGGQTLNSR